MFVELSYKLSPGAPVFPGHPPDEFHPLMQMSAGDPCNTTIVKHHLHNGTHVDAPYHFDRAGATIDCLPIGSFVYERPLLVLKPLGKGGLVERADLEAHGTALAAADILLLCTGYYALRTVGKVYTDDFPSLAADAARFIRAELPRLKAVAIDTLSIESSVLGPRLGFQVHRALLARTPAETPPLLVYEDVNLQPILDRQVLRIYAFPLRASGLEASPVSMVAEVP
jgi:kynurenine formamidase